MADEKGNGESPQRPGVDSEAVGSEADVAKVAGDIRSSEIWAITVAGEPFTSRRQRLLDMIEELKARIDASERGHDLEPLLEQAEAALRTVEERGDDEGRPESEEGSSNAGRPK